MNASLDTFTVRPYSVADRERCLGLFHSNVPKYFAPQEEPEYASYLDKNPSRYLLLVDEQGELLGAGGFAAARQPAAAVLCWGIVRNDQHQRGLGRALLLARLREIAADLQFQSVVLSTSQHTVGFFERFGFVVLQTQPNGFAPGIDQYDMRLDLTAQVRAKLDPK